MFFLGVVAVSNQLSGWAWNIWSINKLFVRFSAFSVSVKLETLVIYFGIRITTSVCRNITELQTSLSRSRDTIIVYLIWKLMNVSCPILWISGAVIYLIGLFVSVCISKILLSKAAHMFKTPLLNIMKFRFFMWQQ